MRVVSSEERGWGERNCRHAHERQWGSESVPLGCGGVRTRLLPFVLRNEGSTNDYFAAKLRDDRKGGDARVWLLFFFVLNVCCFSCFFV